jgi:selenocysteine-specific elongation factor
MKNFIIGTAGHIDHGKTELIKALTGVDTDRLQEEKERGISIELGFAELDLPGGIAAGIVDVPGHEHFIKNMLSGATGFDMVLLTVAADDGVMPQTVEHLAIVDLLDVKEGVVVITKADLVDADILELVEEDVEQALEGTALEGAEIVVTSSRTGQGLDELRQAISRIAQGVVLRDSQGPFRLPVDRVFSLKGIGTVITGTLWQGSVADGDEAMIFPAARKVRVRNVQVHGEDVDRALAGQRVALNLPGISKHEIERGDVIGSLPYLHASLMLDAHLRLLPAARPLKNRARVRLHHGTREVMARVILLGGREQLLATEEADVQYMLEAPLVALYGDRYILRSYSPMTTIGGGVLLDTHPRKHRHQQASILSSLKKRREGDPQELLLLITEENKKPLNEAQLLSLAEIKEDTFKAAMKALLSEEKLLTLRGEGQAFYSSPALAESILKELTELIGQMHEANPLKPGIDKEAVRARMKEALEPEVFEALIRAAASKGQIEAEGGRLRLKGKGRSLSEKELAEKEALKKAIVEGAFNPPLFKELGQNLGLDRSKLRDLLRILMEEGEIEQVNPDYFLAEGRLEEAEERIRSFIAENGRLGVSELRDMLGASRKYSIPLLEYFDRKRVTRREGDYRIAY